MKSLFIIAIVAVAMIGVMVPSVFATHDNDVGLLLPANWDLENYWTIEDIRGDRSYTSSGAYIEGFEKSYDRIDGYGFVSLTAAIYEVTEDVHDNWTAQDIASDERERYFGNGKAQAPPIPFSDFKPFGFPSECKAIKIEFGDIYGNVKINSYCVKDQYHFSVIAIGNLWDIDNDIIDFTKIILTNIDDHSPVVPTPYQNPSSQENNAAAQAAINLAPQPVVTSTIITVDESGFSQSCAMPHLGCYVPLTAVVSYGDTVTMINTDPTGVHTYTSGTVDGFTPSPDGTFDTGVLMYGDSFQWQANVFGEVPYYCMLHTWMAGTIVVQGSAPTPESVAPTPSSQENSNAAILQNYLDYLGISVFNMNQNTELKPYSQLSKYSDYEKGFSVNYPSSLEISENYQSSLGGLGWVKFGNDPVMDIFHFSVYGFIPFTYTDNQSLMQQQLQYMSNLAEEQNITFELIDQYVIEENGIKHFFISSIISDYDETWFDLNDWVLVEDKIIQTNSSINVTIIGLLTSLNPELIILYVGGESFSDYLQKAHQDILMSFTVNINSNEEPIVKVTSTSNCGPGTEDVNGICQVIQTKEKSKGGGCLIATATYGSEMAIEVQQLRELRDNTLLNTESGTAFMGMFNDVYYSFSPIIADYERENPYFKEAVKLAITPMISSLSLMENATSESEVLGLGLSVIMLNIGMYLGVPAIVIVGIRKKF